MIGANSPTPPKKEKRMALTRALHSSSTNSFVTTPGIMSKLNYLGNFVVFEPLFLA